MAALARCFRGRLAAIHAVRFGSNAAAAQMTLNKHPQVAQAVVAEQPGGGLKVSVLPVSTIKRNSGFFAAFGGIRTLLQPAQLGEEDIKALLADRGDAAVEIVASVDELPASSHDRVVLLDLLQALFHDADADSDGAITLSEFKGFTQRLGLDCGDSSYQEIFLDYDPDMDYSLSFKEFKAMLLGTKLLAVKDVSGDGVAAEFCVDQTLMHLVAGHIFAKADLDGDGKISREEVAALLAAYNIDQAAAEVFDKFDTDDDGKIGLIELKQLLFNLGVLGEQE